MTTFANIYFDWMPAWTDREFAILVAVCAAVWVLLRLFWGKSLVSGRAGLVALRCCTLGIVAAILAGPTIIDEQDGEVTRPSMLYVLDGSQSMQLGQTESRWDHALRFLNEAEESAGLEHVQSTQSFRFGHQLKPLQKAEEVTENDEEFTETEQASQYITTSLPSASASAPVIAPPDASDSRLADALRQLLPQVNANSTAGVVLLSDGRVRATDTVEQLAEFFGKSNIPIHVVPTGQATGTGDIAVVSLVVPNQVRKFTENELQVFIRSFGYTGQRTTVRVQSRSRLNEDAMSTLAEVPITLRGGAQSVPLTFRVDERPEDLVITVDPIEGELAERNNKVETHVDINRTKVRVLYIEGRAGSTQSYLNSFFGISPRTQTRSADGLTVRDALQADEDVECTMLVTSGGRSPTGLSDGSSGIGAFPRTRAELFAYDCVVFSDAGPDVLEEEQVEWLAQWVEGRGGGLIVAGSSAWDWNAWRDSPLEPLLPVSLSTAKPALTSQVQLNITAPKHPIWRLRLEERRNEELLSDLPTLPVGVVDYVAKSTADVLATHAETDAPLVLVHRAGRGRVLAAAPSFGGTQLETLANAWGPQPERVAAKLWRNFIYWATEGSSTGRRRLIARSDKRFYRPGESLGISAIAYDEGARQTQKYRVWAMFEPASLDDMSLYSPILWPENVVRESGEVGPRIAWGEELQLKPRSEDAGFDMLLQLSETGSSGDSGFRIEMTAYEGEDTGMAFSHGTQVDSTSLAVQILSDPFEQQNPLPNHELLNRVASISGGEVLEDPDELAALLTGRPETHGPPSRELTPAWSRWWLWLCVLALLSTEWVWRRVTGLA